MALSAAGIVCTLAAALTVLSAPASADSVVVTVLDRDGKPVPGVAVFLESPELAARPVLQPSAVMDQQDKRFVPHLLVVQAGTSVEFPNSDTIAHHVYSFSYPNEFKLPIYKGDAYPPISFADSGVVILGCNVHDNMLGYILVVDTPVFAKTDAEGHATLEAELSSDARISVWSPRIRDDIDGLSINVAPTGIPTQLTVRLAKALRAPHDDQSESLTWSEY